MFIDPSHLYFPRQGFSEPEAHISARLAGQRATGLCLSLVPHLIFCWGYRSVPQAFDKASRDQNSKILKLVLCERPSHSPPPPTHTHRNNV